MSIESVMSRIAEIQGALAPQPAAAATAAPATAAPASAIARIWRMVASKSAVSVFVIDWTATGAPPPIGTPPTLIWRLEATS